MSRWESGREDLYANVKQHRRKHWSTYQQSADHAVIPLVPVLLSKTHGIVLFVVTELSATNCGGMAEILDATTDDQDRLHFSKSAYDVLNSPAVDPSTLEKLKSIIAKQQKAKKPSKKALAEEIRQETPEASGLADLLVPTNAGEFYAFLGFLLALITFLQMMRGSNRKAGSTVINNFYYSAEPETAAFYAAYRQGGLKRKDPCPCGSGKKFKNCHGDLESNV